MIEVRTETLKPEKVKAPFGVSFKRNFKGETAKSLPE